MYAGAAYKTVENEPGGVSDHLPVMVETAFGP